MDQMNAQFDIMAGPIVFNKDRRDGLRDVFVVKFDGKKEQAMPGVYSWNGEDGK